MQFTPQSESEIDDELILADGVYDFEVMEAQDAVSKKGNDMIALKLRVFADDGSARIINDWLLPTPALSKRKLARFCRSVGIESEYDAGVVEASHCEGRAGKVVIKRKDQGQYGMQPTVETYEPATPSLEAMQAKGASLASKPPAKVTGVPAKQQEFARKHALDAGEIPF